MRQVKIIVVLGLLGGILPFTAGGADPVLGTPKGDKPRAHVSNGLVVETPSEVTPQAKAYSSYCKGVMAVLDGKRKEAKAFFEESLKYDPKALLVHQELAEICARDNDQQGYFEHTKKMVELDPTSLDGHWGLGLYYEATRQPKEAAAEFEKAIHCKSQDPTQAVVIRFKLAEIYRGLGNPQKTLELCEQIQKEKPNERVNRAMDLLMAQTYFDMKDYTQALAKFKSCIAHDVEGRDPTTLIAYQGLTESYLAQKRDSDAIGFLNFTVRLVPENFEFMRLLAAVYDRTGRTDEAVKAFNGYAAAYPKTLGPSFLLAGFYEKAGQAGDAIAAYSKIIGTKEPLESGNNLRLLSFVNLSNIYARQNRHSDAIQLMTQAVGMVPEQNWRMKAAQDLLLHLVFLYDQAGRGPEAEALLKKMLAADPNNPQANNYLGYFYADRGVNLDQAVELVNLALKVEPENGAYLDSLGWALFKQAKEGGSPSLQDVLQKLLHASERNRKEEGGEDPVILDHIATVYFCMGKWELAKEKWEASLARAKELAKQRPNALPNAEQVQAFVNWINKSLDQEERSRRLRLPISKRGKRTMK